MKGVPSGESDLHGGDDADATCSAWKRDEGIVTDPSENRSPHSTTMVQDVSLTNRLFISDRNLHYFPPTEEVFKQTFLPIHRCISVIIISVSAHQV